jgi:hypothetical protein
MTPAKYDFKVWRGTAGPTQGIVFRLLTKDENDVQSVVPYQDVRLSIFKGNKTLIQRLTLENGRLQETDEYAGEIMWAPTAAETRLVPLGNKATYEIEVWNGPDTEIVYLYGAIEGLGGINDDQDDEES